ncbi:MAG: DUF4395 domain-containing protein [Anaerolineae bacterium]
MLDQTALRFNQGAIVLSLAIAFLADWPWLVAIVGAIMPVGTIWPQAALFKQIYARFVRPRGWLRPDLQPDDPEPHLFAQGVGGLFLAAASIAFIAGAPWVGWALAGVVVALALVNLLLRFCLGCFIYYQMERVGVRLDLPWWHTSARRDRP